MIERRPVIAYADEPLRMIVYRMAETGLTRLPVVERENGTLVGMLCLNVPFSYLVKTLPRTRFIPAALLECFACRGWPPATVTNVSAKPARLQVDLKDRVRRTWG